MHKWPVGWRRGRKKRKRKERKRKEFLKVFKNYLLTLQPNISPSSPSRTHSLIWCCCSWWSSHDTDISKILKSFASTWLHFEQYSFPGSLQELQPWYIVPVLRSSSWPLHTFKINTTWMTLMLPRSADSTGYNSGSLWNIAYVCWFSGNTSQKISPWQHWSLHNHSFIF